MRMPFSPAVKEPSHSLSLPVEESLLLVLLVLFLHWLGWKKVCVEGTIALENDGFGPILSPFVWLLLPLLEASAGQRPVSNSTDLRPLDLLHLGHMRLQLLVLVRLK